MDRRHYDSEQTVVDDLQKVRSAPGDVQRYQP